MKKQIKKYFGANPSVRLKTKEIAKLLKVKNNQSYSQLKSLLYQLVKEGFLTKVGKRYQLAGKKLNVNIITGKLQLANNQNYGFVIPKDKKFKDVYIAERNLGTALNGDLVEVSLFAKSRGKNIEGKVIKIIEPANEEIVGTLKKSGSFYYVEPDSKKIHRDIYIPSSKVNGAKTGDKVVATGLKWNSNFLNPEGIIKETLGKAGSYETEINTIAKEFNLTYKFPTAVLNEVDQIEEKISPSEIKNRLDLRDKVVFTIDPVTAKDFDDALSIDVLPNGNYLVGVHIADVSHYVKPGSALYNEALKRSTSVYFVGSVIPMLPEKLSNGVCSLVPNQDRLTYSVMIELSPTAKIVNYEIRKTVINSKRRFNYGEVQKIIETQKGDFNAQIILLNHFAKLLRQKRTKKGSINFIRPEVEFKLNKAGKPVELRIKKVQESNELVEEFMLLANQIVARHPNKKVHTQFPFVYRIHDVPSKEKLTEFTNFVRSLGYNFNPDSKNSSKELQKLLDKVKGSPEEAVVNEIAIRTMAKAIYSTKNIGHFGLSFKYYTHFTSPIRRFPDLIVHLLIFGFINNNRKAIFNLKQLDNICEHASNQERNATDAERLSIKLKQMEYLKDKLGEEFEAVISGVTNFGLFVELKDTLAEGLVSIRDLDDDFYIFDEKKYQLKGRSRGKKYRLGDKINVRLARVDYEKREIDFTLS